MIHPGDVNAKGRRVRIEPLESRLLLHAGHDHAPLPPTAAEAGVASDSPVVIVPTATGQPMLPDMLPLASEENEYVYGWEYDSSEFPGRTLLRLTTAMGNRGTGPMELNGGTILPDGTQEVFQRINLEGGGSTSRLAGTFSYHPEHEHIHFDGFAAYRLRNVGPGDSVGPVVAQGDKVSYCLLDSVRFSGGLAGSPPFSVYYSCEQKQGISVGWADLYTKDLANQWIDITNVADGRYWLEVEVDPDNRLLESDETNNTLVVPIDLRKPPPDPMVVAHDPVGQYPGAATAVDFIFDQPMRTTSFSLADDLVSFTGPVGADLGGQVTGFSWRDTHTLRVTFNAQPALGPYAMTIGPNILAADNGAAMDQDRDKTPGESVADRYTATFTVDNRIGPDVFGYDARATPFENLDLVRGAPGVNVLLDNHDDSIAAVALGTNTFNFYGQTYTGNASLYASVNGFISFGGGSTVFSNDDLTTEPSQATIAALWDDLLTNVSAADAVLWKLEDTTGDGVAERLVVEWNAVRRHGDPGPAAAVEMTFQAILTLNTGTTPGAIVFNYRDIETGSAYANGADATVGIKAAGDQTAAGKLLLVSQDRGNHPLLASGRAIRIAPAPAAVVGRHLFYNRSAFDGNNAGANAQDDGAIAPGKTAYSVVPGPAGTGRASFANLSAYSRGINGVMVDLLGLFGKTPLASDFAVATGDDLHGTWKTAPAPTVTVRRGAGTGGSDRVTLTWADNAIRNTWLRVTVKSTANTGLAATDEFFFAHLAGETGDRASIYGAAVGAVDVARTRGAASPTASLASGYDHNRDGRVNANDLSVTRANQPTSLRWLNGPTSPASAASVPANDPVTRDLSRRRSSFLLDEQQGM